MKGYKKRSNKYKYLPYNPNHNVSEAHFPAYTNNNNKQLSDNNESFIAPTSVVAPVIEPPIFKRHLVAYPRPKPGIPFLKDAPPFQPLEGPTLDDRIPRPRPYEGKPPPMQPLQEPTLKSDNKKNEPSLLSNIVVGASLAMYGVLYASHIISENYETLNFMSQLMGGGGYWDEPNRANNRLLTEYGTREPTTPEMNALARGLVYNPLNEMTTPQAENMEGGYNDMNDVGSDYSHEINFSPINKRDRDIESNIYDGNPKRGKKKRFTNFATETTGLELPRRSTRVRTKNTNNLYGGRKNN